MNSLTVILGRRRQGKSTLALAVAAARSKSIIILDVNSQYRSIPSVPIDQELIEESLLDPEGCLLVFRPDAASLTDSWHTLADILWQWEDYALILDEASEFQSAGWRDEWLDRFLRQAPDSVHVIMTTHRVVDFAKLSRALSSDVFIFQTRQQSDIDLLSAEFPGLAVEVITTLPAYHVLHHWVDHGGIGRNNLWSNPTEWYVGIGEGDGKSSINGVTKGGTRERERVCA